MKFVIIIAALLFCLPCAAQETDSIPRVTIDTVRQEVTVEQIEMYANQFVPRRASLYSAIFPGAGQIYNKKYWKLPLVYGGFVALGLVVDYYNDLYKEYRSNIFSYLDDSSFVPPNGATLDQTRTLADNARRERDFWIAMTGVFYLLQIADAHIDAHLKEFELNPELKLSLEPDVQSTNFAGQAAGFASGISIKLKF